MSEYHKIQTVWLRDPATNHKTLLNGQWATPEFEYLSRVPWEFEEKVDGTNVRVCLNGFCERVEFRGKTDNAQMPPHLLARLTAMFPLDALDAAFECQKYRDTGEAPDIVLYGEGYGAKIQKGGGDYIPDGCSFILFDVRVGAWWLRREDVRGVAERLGIKAAPVVGSGWLMDAILMARDGFKSELRATPPEGLVMRPLVELRDRAGARIISKVKCKDFAK